MTCTYRDDKISTSDHKKTQCVASARNSNQGRKHQQTPLFLFYNKTTARKNQQATFIHLILLQTQEPELTVLQTQHEADLLVRPAPNGALREIREVALQRPHPHPLQVGEDVRRKEAVGGFVDLQEVGFCEGRVRVPPVKGFAK